MGLDVLKSKFLFCFRKSVMNVEIVSVKTAFQGIYD